MSSKGGPRRSQRRGCPPTEGPSTPEPSTQRRKEAEAEEADEQTQGHGGAAPPHALSSAFKAMNNELVFPHIAKGLPLADLQRLRQTCKKWNKTFVPQLKDTSEIFLGDKEKDYGSWHRGAVPVELKSMKEFTNLMRSSLRNPFSRYTVFGVEAVPDQVFNDFFDVCGSSIHHITLYLNGVWRKRNLGKVWKVIFELTPNLRTLDLHSTFTDDSSQAPSSALRKPLPNLRTLKLHNEGGPEPCPEQQMSLMQDVLVSATQLEEFRTDFDVGRLQWLFRNGGQGPNINLSKLKVLQLDGITLHLLTELLRKEPAVRLTEFYASVYFRHLNTLPETTRLLNQFLQTQVTTLKVLELWLSGVTRDLGPTPVVSLPPMPNLEEFSLLRRQETVNLLPYFGNEGGTLATIFPALSRLKYQLVTWTPELTATAKYELASSDLARLAHNGVTDLVLIAEIDDGYGLTTLVTRLPSVTHLDLTMTTRAFFQLTCAWTLWPALQVLKVECIYYRNAAEDDSVLGLDELLTGVEPGSHKFLQRSIRRLKKTEPVETTLGYLRDLLAKYKTKAGISDLKQLKQFSLKLGGFRGEPVPSALKGISDVGGYFGLAMASSQMQILSIGGVRRRKLSSGIISFSPDCVDFIRSVFRPPAVVKL